MLHMQRAPGAGRVAHGVPRRQLAAGLAQRQRGGAAASVGEARQSIDPMASMPKPTAWSPGTVFPVHNEGELQQLMQNHNDKLVVLECKASHCKPCKRFAPSYLRIAELMSDSVMLEVTGDESPESKKWMLAMGVKVTPTFRMYRGGEYITAVTGAKLPKILSAITEQLKDGERGKFLQPEDIEPPESDDE